MNTINLGTLAQNMIAWRHQIHRHPETAYTEFKTSELIAKVLADAGLEVHTGIAETGVVGVLKQGNSSRSIGLRADMDALHIQELNDFEHRSQISGKMHACGHDGHTSMLLGAACYLAKNRNFDGTIHFIFQPAEENEGGGKRMLDEGLFKRFPVDQVFGMHNMPSLNNGQFSICSGPMMAAFATFECTITGKGTHSAMPESGIDPIVPAMAIVQGWQDFKNKLSEKDEKDEKVILSTTQFHAGDTWNVIPEQAVIGGSARCFSQTMANMLESEMACIAKEVSREFGVVCEFDYKRLYPPLINSPDAAAFSADVAASLVGENSVVRNMEPLMGSEDFAYMLEAKPGAYILIGNDGREHGGCMVHNPNYDFNDEILELGARYWVSLAESFLS